MPPPSPAPGDPCVQSLGASAGTAEELYPKLKSRLSVSGLSVAGPIPGTSTYEESSLLPGFAEEEEGGEARYQALQQAAELGVGTETVSRQAFRAGLGEPYPDV